MENDEKHASLVSSQSKTFNVVQLFKLLHEKSRHDKIEKTESDEKGDPVFVSPSEYMRQMVMTTEKRTDFLLKLGRKFDLKASINEQEMHSFKAIPSIVIFQQFEPGSTYNVNLLIQNVSKVSQYLKMICERNPNFQIEFKGSILNTRLAPGMALAYDIKFSPEEKRDYEYEASFVSDHEIFRVPVIAIGPRAILDFPDRIEIPTTAVKISSSKTLLVRNIGHVPAIFSLYTADPKFSIDPSQGVIDEEEMIQFTLSFLSNKTGDFETKLFLKYESGEIVRLDLQGSAVNCNIRLERGSLKMEDTFLSMSRSKPFTIYNRSDHIVKFRWMRYKDSEEDEKKREKYKQMFNVIKNLEMTRCVDLVHYNICAPEAHSLICQRIYADEITSLTNEAFFYQNNHFVLEPTEGEIWPQSSTNVMVYFQPEKIGEISSTAYLEITGRENRLPLSLSGNCIGPILQLTTITLNIGSIYLHSSHNYEVISTNKGLIPGTLVHKSKSSDFGGIIIIDPLELKLRPGEFRSFIITFSSNRKGEFVERIDFVIKESLEVVSMYIKGCIVCPILRFEKDSIDFGITALGFTNKQDLYLHNHSSVPVSFNMSVPDDGYEPAVTCEDFSTSQTKPTFPFHPKEFIITPLEGVVSANSSLKVTISYTANIARSGQTSLRLEMWESESEAIFLPIAYSGKIANFEINPPEITIGFCFINLPYTQNILIENKSDIEGYFYIVPQSPSLSSTILYSMPIDQGYLKPGHSKTITMTVITKSLGKQETPVMILPLGESSPITCCTLICNGQGPVISVEPSHLDWENLTLLENKSLDLSVVNDSPIEAEFTISLGRRNSPWSVQPIAGELSSNQSIKLEVMAFLRDAGKYTDRLLIKIANSRTISITLVATGIGSCIVSKPNIFPTFDMGLLFSHQDICLPITLINEGNRHQQLLFTNITDVRTLTKGPPQNQTYDKFQVEPNMIELPPRASTIVYCKIHWNKNETVTEEWYLHAFIQGEGKRELKGSSLFRASFIEPHISFSKTELQFRVDVDTSGVKSQEIDELYVTNESGLDLHTHLTIDPPFLLITDSNQILNKMDIVLQKNVQLPIKVCFAFNREEKCNSRIVKGILQFEYDEHPNKDKIKCKAEVNFPTIIPIPRELYFSCELGSSASRKLVLLNEMPIPLFYRFEWLEDSISINRLQPKPERSLWVSHEEETDSNSNESSRHLIPPLNSPSINEPSNETQIEIEEVKCTENSDFNNEFSISINEVREFLMEMLDWSDLEEPELKALQNLSNDPPQIDFINEIIEISPEEGMILPYTTQSTNLVFHGFEPLKVEAQLLCEVTLGSPEIINISAVADNLRFHVTKNYIDLGQQIFCEKCQTSFHLESQCFIPFTFKINTREISQNLKIEPNSGQVEPMSNVLFQITYQPDTLGPFEEEIQLLVEHVPPFSVLLRGFAVVPQVYFCLPKTDIFKNYPFEFGYYAIQLINDNYKNEDFLENGFCEETTCDDVSISEVDYKRLADESWEIINREDAMPSANDIDMAFERLLAKKFIKENLYSLEKHRSEHRKGGIPCLLTPEYVVDLGYVVVQKKVHCSATLVNFGPGKVEVRLKKLENKGDLTKSGIFVEFNDTRNLLVGESILLHVSCQPKQERYKERVSNIQYIIYLEVTHGFTIPVIIKAIITYPFLTVSTKHLNFSNVVVGQCHQMRLLIRNEGFVECHWEAHLISNRKKRDEGPFYVHYTSDIFSPGHSGVIDVYFKPRKSCSIESKLLITVLEGQETLSITLSGKGIEHRLKISESSIKFMPLIPNSMADEKTVIVENPSPYPVEFYWLHLDNPFLHEDRVGRVLIHYYQVKEILMPQRQVGEKMPQQLLDFYARLVKEMAADLAKQRAEELKISTVEEKDEVSGSIEGKASIEINTSQGIKKRKKVNRRKTSKGGKSRSESISSEISKKEKNSVFADLEMLTTDPQEIENLLHNYIDHLQKSPDFSEKMEDPVKGVFEALEPKATDLPNGISKNKKIFIIFHGAPFTRYQEAACQSAKVLGIPVLNLNKAFIEIISSGNDEFSTKLRRTIDSVYEEYMAKIKAHKQTLLSIQEAGKQSFPDTSRTTKSGSKRSARDTSRGPSIKNAIINTDVLSELQSIPSGNELKAMDAYSCYESKIQSILLIEKILSPSTSISPIKDKSSARGSVKKKFDVTFLGLDYDTLKTVLKLRISMPDFKNGFVLQTLNNEFVKNNVNMLLSLLEIVEDIEFFMFVTFHNSIGAYKDRISRLFQEKEEKAVKEVQEKLEKLKRMSQSEIDLLSEEDKIFYTEEILSRKSQEAISRRKQYEDKVSKLKEKKLGLEKLLHPSLEKLMKNKAKINKKNKATTIDTANEKPDAVKPLSPRKATETRPSSKSSTGMKNSEKQKELEDISGAMEQYLFDLEALLEVIKDWDPVRKEIPAKRLVKGKDKSQATTREHPSTSLECFTWHVKPSDPWDEKMYDLVVSQLSQNELISTILGTMNILPEPDLRSKMYSVLIPKKLQSNLQTETEVCSPCLTSSKQHVPAEMSITSLSVKEESTMSMSRHQLRQSVSQSKEKWKMPTSSIGLVQSTISSRSDSIASNISLTPTIIEEPLKPTWVLQPYESQTYKVRFFPDKVGLYRENFFLTIVDSIDKTYNIKVEGVSDIPRINMDASVIFSRIEKTKINEANDPAYFLDTNTFDFGSLLINRKDNSKPHCRSAQFKFTNISLIPACVTFSLKGDNSNAFIILSEQLIYIQPEETYIVELSAVAQKLGTNSARLMISISDNPEVHAINLRVNGSKVDVELEDKNVNFDRILLYREEKQSIRIHNKSTISIFWRLKTIGGLNSQITFSPNCSSIKPKDSGTVEFTLQASKVGLLERNALNFEVFLRQDDQEPLLSEVITVNGDVYDVSVDVNYANPIDLKSVKVDSATSEKFVIKNRGLYEIKYAVQLEPDDVLSKIDSNLSKGKAGCFDIHPVADSILPEKTATVNVLFKPRKEIVLKNAPILKCYLFDTFRKNALVAEVPLTVSVISYYTRFRIHPFPELNFGSVGIYTQKIMYLNIENTGKFPLRFTVSIPGSKLPLQFEKGKKKDLDLVSKRDKKSPRNLRTNESSLKTGSFTVTKIEGEIDAGQIETLEIICNAERQGEQVEEITVFVADCLPDDKNGKTLKLLANCCMPHIDFHDLDTIFHENNVVDSLQNFKCPKELGAHTVFARREKCLYFCRIPVSSAHTTCFKLCNRSEVQTDVMISLRPEMLAPQNSKIDAFIVSPSRDCIPPMSNRIFTISFTPNLIETYSAVLEAKIELPSHLKTDRLSVRLLGEACVPEVILIEPSARTKRDRIILSFSRTLVGETGIRKLAFQNISFLEAKVIVEVFNDPNFLFSLESVKESTRLVHTFDSDGGESSDRYIVCTLTPDEIAHFRVKFQPNEVGKYESSIRITVVGNPYENITLALDGESFNEAIVLDGLEFADSDSIIHSKTNIPDSTRKKRKSTSKNISAQSSQLIRISSPAFASLIYKLDYGSCFLNRMSKISFKIVNKTEDRSFRFEWSQHPNLIFNPTVGHLSPCRSKEIIATFLSAEAITHFQTLLDCTIQEILYPKLEKRMSWDDRQTNIKWNERKSYYFDSETSEQLIVKKIIEPMVEPIYEIVSGSTRYIQLSLSALAAYSEYECKVQHIIFKDTLMFQSTNFKFLLTNPASVNLEYNWKLTMDDQYPIRLGESTFRSNFKERIKSKSQSRPSSRSSKGILYPNLESLDNNRNDVNYIIQNNTKETDSEEGSYQRSDLFSSKACLSDRSTDSWIDSDNWPFEIQPENGIIPPGESLEFSLKFSPLDVFDYKACLKCIIENHNPKQTPLCIPIKARSLLPYCHFDILESDYLTSGRRNKKLPGPIDCDIENPSVYENIRVIEFKVIGVGECHTKDFNLINPTMDDYTFSWTDRTIHQNEDVPNFHFNTLEGIVEKGQRSNVSFTFHAEDVGTLESFWSFKIDKCELETLFLIVAHVSEPEAYFLPVHLQMKATALGWKVSDKITIVNKEDFELVFKIMPESLYSEGRFHNLIIKPMSGILMPNSEQTLNVEYQPKMDGEVTFSVQCEVQKIKNPITTFVKTKAYSIEPQIFYKNSQNQSLEIYHHRDNFIDFGKLDLNKPSTIEFGISNVGKISFFYKWDLGLDNLKTEAYNIILSETEGYVDSESQITCYLTLTPLEKIRIKDHLIKLEINKGPIYFIYLKASARKPSVEFSFSQYDFGLKYVQETFNAPYHVDLQITNFEKTPSIIECMFEDLPHMLVDLDNISQAINGNSSVTVRIHFRPIASVQYRETLNFLINSASEKNVVIRGEGIPYKVRLENPCEKSIDLGNIPVGKISTRKIKILNEGRAPIELKFGLIKILEASKESKKIDPAKQDFIGESDSPLMVLSQALSIQPEVPMVLPPNKKLNLVFKFKPKKRIKQFLEKVGVQMNSTILPLTIVRGSCVGAEFQLNRTYISFGTIVEGCTLDSKLILLNTGDVGARFKWNTSKLGSNFNIKPISGYCSPGMDVSFVVSFRPTHQANFMEGESTIEIEKYGNITITVCGGCGKLPDPLDTLNFTIQVRQKQTKQVGITNDTSETWVLKPETNGDYFFTDEVLTVPPKKTGLCTVSYFPLVMNVGKSSHKGNLIVKLPGGMRPILYTLAGTSLPPEVVATIFRQFPAKTKYTESLPVYNWLNRPQKFDCRIELVRLKTPSIRDENPIYTFTGNTKLDVPASGRRDYRAIFHCYKESNFSFKIIFTNAEEEYQYYELQYKVMKPETVEVIKLTTNVRSVIYHFIQLDNPLDNGSIKCNVTCPHQYITIHDVPKMVPALSNEKVKIEYNPLLSSEEITRLEVNCAELGTSFYELRLTAKPAPAEEVIRVTATLGSFTTFPVTVSNLSKKNTEFIVKLEDLSFTCAKSIMVQAQNSGILEVTYEPCDIENVTATLIISSNIAGQFIFPITASYIRPKPQGPFPVMTTKPCSIQFKNVFLEAKTFEFFLDASSCFSLNTLSEIIESKKCINIIINLNAEREQENFLAENQFPATGKLIVTCTDPTLSKISWIYYLRSVSE